MAFDFDMIPMKIQKKCCKIEEKIQKFREILLDFDSTVILSTKDAILLKHVWHRSWLLLHLNGINLLKHNENQQLEQKRILFLLL